MINYKNLGKIAVKVAIALTVVACAYFFGRYQANNDCKARALGAEVKQANQALNSFVENAKAINTIAVDLVAVTNKIGESTHESKTEYIKVVERVPIHSECIIDTERLQVLNSAVTNANASIARSISSRHARSQND